jgi:alkanesulfonate monooxygenase SsuD/methylene tetrahydromethanopterin reductase-like flavin-dependent oxidoreductase (luciferase family)
VTKPHIHLAQFLCHGPSYHSLAMWWHPRTAAAGYDWARPELYQHIARVCERGKFDMVFFADLNYISDTYRGTMDPAIRHATQAPEHDPVPLLSFMGAVTTRIGLRAIIFIRHQHPFYAARLWATLDHLTRGRPAWNVVTSLNHNQAANHAEERKPTDERYDRAHEFMEVCRKLWDSWEHDAVVMDREAGVFADPARVAKGRTFAARYADAIFAIQPNIAGAKAYYEDIERETVREGRMLEACNGRHAGRDGRSDGGLRRPGRRRRIHAVADLHPGSDRGVRGSRGAGGAAARPLPGGLRRHHAARSPDAGALTAVTAKTGGV